jgi:hypothetical protein
MRLASAGVERREHRSCGRAQGSSEESDLNRGGDGLLSLLQTVVKRSAPTSI